MPSTNGTPKDDKATRDWIKSLEKQAPPKTKAKRVNFAVIGRTIAVQEDTRPVSPRTQRRQLIAQTSDKLARLSDEWNKQKQYSEAHKHTKHLHGRLDSGRALLFFERPNGMTGSISRTKEESKAVVTHSSLS